MLLCQAFDNSNRLFYDDYIDMFCQQLMLSPVQSLSLAFALTQSQKSNLPMEALMFMKKILPLVSGNPLAEITEETLMAMVHFILHNKVFYSCFIYALVLTYSLSFRNCPHLK